VTHADISREAQARLLNLWRREEQQPFHGWNFAYLSGRMSDEQPPWSYAFRATELLRGASSVVDLAVARHNVPTATFLQQDMLTLDFAAETFDGVAAFYTLIHLPYGELPGFLRKMGGWVRRIGSWDRLEQPGTGSKPSSKRRAPQSRKSFRHIALSGAPILAGQP
jgi:hypothetical protein